MEDNRTLRELAKEALDVQDACNLSGVVHGWSRAITRLRELLGRVGTDELNSHPINVMWSDKCAHLTGSDHGLKYTESYLAVCQMANKVEEVVKETT